MRKLLLSILLLSGLSGISQNMSSEDYINHFKDAAIQEMQESGVPASITLAQGILESSNGNSELAKKANNHFGIKCHNDWEGESFILTDDSENECFRKYSCVKDSYHDHSLFLRTRQRYANLFKLATTDYISWAKGLKEAGYATNPKYAELLINLIERFNLHRFDTEQTLASTSYNKENQKDISSKTAIAGRKVFTNNRTDFIIAKQYETYESIAKEMEMMPWQLYRYNDLAKNSTPKAGQIIYIKPKRRKADKDFHIVKNGETMYEISQKYAIKLKKLYKRNNMTPDSEVKAGLKLILR